MSEFISLISVNGERFLIEKSVLTASSGFFGARLSERWNDGKTCVATDKISVFPGISVFRSEVQMSCEPQIVRYLIQLMKYRSWRAFYGDISESDSFKLRKEVDFYQIELEKGELHRAPIRHGVPPTQRCI